MVLRSPLRLSGHAIADNVVMVDEPTGRCLTWRASAEFAAARALAARPEQQRDPRRSGYRSRSQSRHPQGLLPFRCAVLPRQVLVNRELVNLRLGCDPGGLNPVIVANQPGTSTSIRSVPFNAVRHVASAYISGRGRCWDSADEAERCFAPSPCQICDVARTARVDNVLYDRDGGRASDASRRERQRKPSLLTSSKTTGGHSRTDG